MLHLSIPAIAREACITDPLVLWAIILGNLGVFLAYLWLPTSIIRILKDQPRIPQPLLWMLAASFILACAFTHATGIIIIFRPYYGLEAGMLALTAFISLITAVAVHVAVPGIKHEVKEYEVLKDRVRTLLADLDKAQIGAHVEPAPEPPTSSPVPATTDAPPGSPATPSSPSPPPCPPCP